MIKNNIKIYCNDEPVLTLCKVYDNNTPVSIEKLNSLASFETMHNTKVDAHKNLFDEVRNMFSVQENVINQKANIEDIPTKVSELENDTNYLTEHQDISDKASINLDNLTIEGLEKLEYRRASKLTTFTANSGNVDENNNPDLLSFDGNKLSFKVGGDYPDLYVTNAQGENYKKKSINDITFSATPYTTTGNYKNFAKEDGFKVTTGCGDFTNAMLNGGVIVFRTYQGYQSLYFLLEAKTPFKLKKWVWANRNNQDDNGYALTYWELQASNNNLDWVILSTKVTSATKYHGSVKWEWDINCETGYKYYKFIPSGQTHGTAKNALAINNISFIADYDYVTSNDDGVYNVMISKDGNAYAIQNNIIKQPVQPPAIHNYIVIGTPAISNNGLLSACANGNAVHTKVQLSQLSGKSWVIKGSAVLGESSHTLVKISSVGDTNYTTFGSVLWAEDTKTLQFVCRTGMVSDVSNTGVQITSSNIFAIGDKVYYSLSFDFLSGLYTLYADKVDGTTYQGKWTPATDNKELYYINTHPEYYISLGAGSDNIQYLSSGLIDMRDFSIKVDGEDIYRAITYDKTIWLDTSKEPLKAYRNDGVGFVNCEDVPVGSVIVEGGIIKSVETYSYGNNEVIVPNKIVPATIIETSDKALLPSWYRIWSDGWCEQGGYSTANGNITLLKPYINTNFNVVVTMKSSTNPTTQQGNPAGAVINNATIFVTAGGNKTAYWQAKGYIK